MKAVAVDIQVQRAERRDDQQQSLAKLNEIASAVVAQQAQAQTMHLLSKRRFVWMCAVLGVNLSVLVFLLVRTFL